MSDELHLPLLVQGDVTRGTEEGSSDEPVLIDLNKMSASTASLHSFASASSSETSNSDALSSSALGTNSVALSEGSSNFSALKQQGQRRAEEYQQKEDVEELYPEPVMEKGPKPIRYGIFTTLFR